MNVGIDFDNTIVSYDEVFYSVALEQGLIPVNLKKSKISVRDHLRNNDKNDVWTELQGYVYGKRLLEANLYPGFLKFLGFAKNKKITLSIISHKTIYPYKGKKYNLHNAAREFIDHTLTKDKAILISQDKVFLEATQKDKALRIEKEKCDYFIDDLPEIFLLENFPKTTVQCLFDPESNHSNFTGDYKFSHWDHIAKYLKHELSRR